MHRKRLFYFSISLKDPQTYFDEPYTFDFTFDYICNFNTTKQICAEQLQSSCFVRRLLVANNIPPGYLFYRYSRIRSLLDFFAPCSWQLSFRQDNFDRLLRFVSPNNPTITNASLRAVQLTYGEIILTDLMTRYFLWSSSWYRVIVNDTQQFRDD